MVEVASTTYVDIIEEFPDSVIFPPNLPPNDRLKEAYFLYFSSCVRVVIFLVHSYSREELVMVSHSLQTSHSYISHISMN